MSPFFIGWPIPGRNPTLEAADIAITVMALRELGLPLGNTCTWLARAAHDAHNYHNNWQFAPILGQLALECLGYTIDRRLLETRVLRLHRNRVGRLFLDEIDRTHATSCFDFYPFWAWSHYADAVQATGYNLRTGEADAELVRLLDLLVLSDGRFVTFGRSSAYDGAAFVPARLQSQSNYRPQRQRARAVYARYWRASLKEWMEERWLDRLIRLSARHCMQWSYGTSYSLMWALRGVDIELIEELLNEPEPATEKGLLVTVPLVASGARSKSGAILAFAAQSPGRHTHVRGEFYTRIAIVEAQSGKDVLRTELGLARGVAGRQILPGRPGITVLRETRHKTGSGLIALMPTPMGIWAAADAQASQLGLVAWQGSRTADREELKANTIRGPGALAGYAARLAIDGVSVSLFSETRDSTLFTP